MIEEEYRTSKIEALILASPEPLSTRRITKVMDRLTPSKVSQAVADLNTGYANTGSSYRIREIAGGYQFYILPEYEGVVELLFARRRKIRLSRAALETVAIVAYRQPTIKTDIEHIRGVASDGVIRTLLEKNLITITGRADTVGKPLQYGTTDEFLKFFGLAGLDDLPQMSEIEQMISSEESRKQTELEFGINADGRLMKLNIIDGTFDPERREQIEDDIPDEIEEAPETAEATETASSQLILKKGEENAGDSLTGDAEKGDNEVAEEPAISGAGKD